MAAAGRAPPAACPQGQRCHLNICYFVQQRIIARPRRVLCIIYRVEALCAAQSVRGRREPRHLLLPPSLLSRLVTTGRLMISSRPSSLPSSVVYTIRMLLTGSIALRFSVMNVKSDGTFAHCLLQDEAKRCGGF